MVLRNNEAADGRVVVVDFMVMLTTTRPSRMSSSITELEGRCVREEMFQPASDVYTAATGDDDVSLLFDVEGVVMFPVRL